MIIKNESDSHKPITDFTDNPLNQTEELNSKEAGPLTEHYEVKGFTGVDNTKKAPVYPVY